MSDANEEKGELSTLESLRLFCDLASESNLTVQFLPNFIQEVTDGYEQSEKLNKKMYELLVAIRKEVGIPTSLIDRYFSVLEAYEKGD